MFRPFSQVRSSYGVVQSLGRGGGGGGGGGGSVIASRPAASSNLDRFSPPQPHPRLFSNATHPFSQLEDHFLRVEGREWFKNLEVDTSPDSKSVIAISGDQLTGKTTILSGLVDHFQGLGLTAGRLFRARAAELGISVPELSRRSLADPAIDIQIEYCIVRDMATGRAASLGGSEPLNHGVLIGEGRMCGVMANYLRQIHGRKNIYNVFITTNPRSQALRWLKREVSLESSLAAETLIPEQDFESLADIAPYIDSMDPNTGSVFRDNIDRDESDRKRFQWFYGDSELLDYRNTDLYDVTVDSSGMESQELVDTAVTKLQKLPDFRID